MGNSLLPKWRLRLKYALKISRTDLDSSLEDALAKYKLFRLISYTWRMLQVLMTFSDLKWEFHGKSKPQPDVLCQKELFLQV